MGPGQDHLGTGLCHRFTENLAQLKETSSPLGTGTRLFQGSWMVISAGGLPNLMLMHCLQGNHVQFAGHHNPRFLEAVTWPGVLGICPAIRRLSTLTLTRPFVSLRSQSKQTTQIFDLEKVLDSPAKGKQWGVSGWRSHEPC